MPTSDKIDAWEKAFDDLRHAHENLKAAMGTRAEESARMVYELTRAKYDAAATDLG